MKSSPGGDQGAVAFLLQSTQPAMTTSRRLFLESLALALAATLVAFAALTLLHSALPRLTPFDLANASRGPRGDHPPLSPT